MSSRTGTIEVVQEGSLKLQVVLTVQEDRGMLSLCVLEDGRLVSCGRDDKIIIYKKATYEPEIVIRNSHGSGGVVTSICKLRNKNLASSGSDNRIKIWEISEHSFSLIHTLTTLLTTGKIIELKDGKLCSYSLDKTIRIWDNKNNYQCIRTLKAHSNAFSMISSIMEMENYILSVGNNFDKSLIVWDKSTYTRKALINGVYANGGDALEKLKDNTVILAGNEELFVVDILSLQSGSFKNPQLGWIICIYTLGNDKVLVGNKNGMVVCFDSLANKITCTIKMHDNGIRCIVKLEDNKLSSSSQDKTVKIFYFFYSCG